MHLGLITFHCMLMCTWIVPSALAMPPRARPGDPQRSQSPPRSFGPPVVVHSDKLPPPVAPHEARSWTFPRTRITHTEISHGITRDASHGSTLAGRPLSSTAERHDTPAHVPAGVHISTKLISHEAVARAPEIERGKSEFTAIRVPLAGPGPKSRSDSHPQVHWVDANHHRTAIAHDPTVHHMSYDLQGSGTSHVQHVFKITDATKATAPSPSQTMRGGRGGLTSFGGVGPVPAEMRAPASRARVPSPPAPQRPRSPSPPPSYDRAGAPSTPAGEASSSAPARRNRRQKSKKSATPPEPMVRSGPAIAQDRAGTTTHGAELSRAPSRQHGASTPSQ